MKTTTMKTSLVAGLLVAGLVTPALAAQYYVAQNNTTHKCSIMSQKPTGAKLTLLGSDGFKTKSDARSAMKGMSECRA